MERFRVVVVYNVSFDTALNSSNHLQPRGDTTLHLRGVSETRQETTAHSLSTPHGPQNTFKYDRRVGSKTRRTQSQLRGPRRELAQWQCYHLG